jgi:hypothetical protein
MKTIIFFSFILITSGCFAQELVVIDTINFVKPGTEEVMLDTSITNNLEAFKGKDDAIIYIYRRADMAGGAVKWHVQVDSNSASLGQRAYTVAHINTTKKSHWISHGQFKINYVNFKPNRYYKYMLKGFSRMTGYLDAEAFKYIKACKRSEQLK